MNNSGILLGGETMSSELNTFTQIAKTSATIKTIPANAFSAGKEQNLSKKIYKFLKRTFDIACSFLALVVLSPVFFIVSILIKIDSPGKAFFSQKRIGKDQKEFNIYKFRSMTVNAEEKLAELKDLNERDGPVFKIKDDPRVTKIGKFLRKTCIDELPQLLNILKGDMSIVGPRPPLAKEVEEYNDYQMQRLSVTPGLTCYWQVQKDQNTTFDEWVELDLKYIREKSFWVDLKIIFLTMRVVFLGKGAD